MPPPLIVCRMGLWVPEERAAVPPSPSAGAVTLEEALAQWRDTAPLTLALQSPAPEIPATPWWQATVEQARRIVVPALLSTRGEPPGNRSLQGPSSCNVGSQLALYEPLQAREREILSLVARGLSNHAIADVLLLGESTVKWYLKHLYRKLGVHSRTQAVARARQMALLSRP